MQAHSIVLSLSWKKQPQPASLMCHCSALQRDAAPPGTGGTPAYERSLAPIAFSLASGLVHIFQRSRAGCPFSPRGSLVAQEQQGDAAQLWSAQMTTTKGAIERRLPCRSPVPAAAAPPATPASPRCSGGCAAAGHGDPRDRAHGGVERDERQAGQRGGAAARWAGGHVLAERRHAAAPGERAVPEKGVPTVERVFRVCWMHLCKLTAARSSPNALDAVFTPQRLR